MFCESCQKKPATVHLTEIIGNKKHEVHLCEDCAKSKGAVKANVSIANLLSGIMESQLHLDDLVMASVSCPICGISFAEFQREGRFGCCEDFEIFHEGLLPLLERIHGATQHYGKSPKLLTEDKSLEQDLHRLQRELSQAVGQEEYEEAAKIRDKIRNLRNTKQD